MNYIKINKFYNSHKMFINKIIQLTVAISSSKTEFRYSLMPIFPKNSPGKIFLLFN